MVPLVDGEVKGLEFRREGSTKLVRVQFYGSNFSVWSWLNSQFKSLFIQNTQ